VKELSRRKPVADDHRDETRKEGVRAKAPPSDQGIAVREGGDDRRIERRDLR
jgi:hypothetical protein